MKDNKPYWVDKKGAVHSKYFYFFNCSDEEVKKLLTKRRIARRLKKSKQK